MMTLRPFRMNQDLEVVNSWANARGMGSMPEHRLSQFGLIAVQGNKDIGACFLYPFKGSGWCMFESLMTNPDSTTEERDMAMGMIFLELCNAARILGYKEVFTTSYLPSVNNKLDSMGFIMNKDRVNHFIGRLV